MNRDELLTKLAMELAEWPRLLDTAKDLGIRSLWKWAWDDGDVVLISACGNYHIRPEHYQDRRTELINEPDDADAPEWAEWKAQDRDGSWHWYECKPSGADSNIWMLEDDGDARLASEGCIPAGHDWRQTLREVKRQPNRQLNPPTSSLTDSQARQAALESGMCSDGMPCRVAQYCDDFHSAPHAQDARRLDEQLRDAINPDHYRKGAVECIDALKAATVGKTGIEAVCVANVIKYLWRYEEKNGVEDVEKALWYLNRLHDELHD